ncbi:MAG TPA: molybdopterin-dependent oxidoreductase, partial [Gammaproteobacteria bacterium]|nr:molybdopterin-dependent oxidoreductase [Gammaproteobacteria bacterium]
YFGRYADGVLENEFSGNLVEVCPTGVFTDKTFSEHYVRKWDLQSAPSVCPHCSLGCNTNPQERYGRLRRVVNRYNGEVNGYFLCDRGRYGYGYVNSERRVRAPLVRAGGVLEPASVDDAVRRAVEGWSDGDVIGIGSPRASVEANFALRRLVGADNFYAGVAALDATIAETAASLFRDGAVRAPSQREAAESDAVLVLGEDLTNTAPRLALTLREAVRGRQRDIAASLHVPAWQDEAVRTAGGDERYPLFVATPAATKLDAIAAAAWRAAPDDIARLGFAVAHRLDGGAPDAALPAEAATLAGRIAETLRGAKRPLVVAGYGARSVAVVEAAANIATALAALRGSPADLCLTLPEANSLGLALLGGGTLAEAFERARSGRVRAAVVLENDLFRRAPATEVERFVAAVPRLVVLDHVENATVRAAHVALPAAPVPESDGTLISAEGRAQRFFQVFVPQGDIRESWRWLAELGRTARRDPAWASLDDVIAAAAQEMPALARIADAAPSARFRIADRKLNREPARWSGRTAVHANVTLREPAPPPDPDSALAFSMEGYHGPRLPPALISFFWAPGWNSVQSVNKFQDEIAGPLRGGDPGVRLLEPGAQRRYFDAPPEAAPLDGGLRLVALHSIFGSEELSALSPPIAERAPQPYVALHPDDAAERRLTEGAEAEVALDGMTLALPVRLDASLVRGAAGLPYGLAGLPPFDADSETVRAARPAGEPR